MYSNSDIYKTGISTGEDYGHYEASEQGEREEGEAAAAVIRATDLR